VSQSEDADGNTLILRADGKTEKRFPFGDQPVGDLKDVDGKSETKVRRAKVRVAKTTGAQSDLVEFVGVGERLVMSSPSMVLVDTPDLVAVDAANAKKPTRVKRSKRVRESVAKATQVNGKKARLDGLFGGAETVELEVSAAGVKEVITLPSRLADGDRVEFRSKVRLSGLTGRNTAAGVEFVNGEGKVRYAAPSGVMWDSSNADSSLTRRGVVSVRLDGDELVVDPDAGWMADPATVFPVMIDPTINVEATRRSYVEQNNPNNAFASGPQFIGNFNNRMRAFERIDTSSLPQSIDSAVLYTRAQYCEDSWWQSPGQAYTKPVRFRKVTGGWGGPQGNPVLNASFETFPAGQPTGLSEWSVRLPSYGSAARVSGQQAGPGEAALKLVAAPGTWMAVESVPYQVMPGEPMFFQMDARVQNPGDWIVARVHFYTDVPASGWVAMTDGHGGVPNSVAAIVDPVSVPPGTTSSLYSGSYTVPAGVKYARISLHHNGSGAFVDNVVTMRNGNSLTANPGMDTVKSWSMRSGAGGFDDSALGNLWMSSFGGWNAVASAPVTVRAGEELTISTDLHMSGGQYSVVRVEYYTGIPAAGWNVMTDNGMTTYSDLPLITAGTGWRTFTGKSTVPPKVKWARLSIHHIGNYSAIAIDNARIVRPNLDPNPFTTTWNTQPTVGTGAGDVVSAPATIQLTDFPMPITDWVRGWIANPASNYGFRLDMDNDPDDSTGPVVRCSFNGGYLSVIYNEGLAAPQPTQVNTLVNGSFESGTYQWNGCYKPEGVAVSTVKDTAVAATGSRYLRLEGLSEGSNACQWIAYDTNGYGDSRLTMTAKIRSKQAGNNSTVIFSQQGNENAGGKYAQSLLSVAAPPTGS
jgi:hypothetical protein